MSEQEQRAQDRNDPRDLPVLIVAFNRPQLIARLLDSLRLVQPRNIYVSVDGPRFPSDVEKVSQVRTLIESIDWPCDLHWQISEVNLGCRRGPTKAIDWFFRNIEEGIILEDDVIPIPQFFDFMHVMLDRYRSERSVGTVIGINRVPQSEQEADHDYRFTRYAHVWGWGTWRRTWEMYRGDIEDWRIKLPFAQLRARVDGSWIESFFWARTFRAVALDHLDAWSPQLQFLAFREGLMSVAPRKSLVENIGFGPDATHTTRLQAHLEIPTTSYRLDLTPIPIKRDARADEWESRHVRGASFGGLSRWLGRRIRETIRGTQ